MHLETSSNLYGETVCPFNRHLTSGGSSGGEGALVGIQGSCLGIGTDIGGSIRSPAANNAVYGFHPASYRLSVGDFTATMLGQEHILPVIESLSTSIQDCKIFTKTLIDQKFWQKETSVLPFPWWDGASYLTRADGKRRLKVAVMWSDGVVKPHPPVIRALKEVCEKLKGGSGVEIDK